MTNESALPYPSLPPVYISTQPTAAVFYKNASADFSDAAVPTGIYSIKSTS